MHKGFSVNSNKSAFKKSLLMLSLLMYGKCHTNGYAHAGGFLENNVNPANRKGFPKEAAYTPPISEKKSGSPLAVI